MGTKRVFDRDRIAALIDSVDPLLHMLAPSAGYASNCAI